MLNYTKIWLPKLAYMKDWTFPEIPTDAPTKWGWRVFGDRLTLGHHTDIGCGTVIHAHCGVTIEPHVQIGPNCSILSKSTIDGKEGPIVIKAKACIGANSVIMPNVTIGENSIIGAGSFINFNVRDNVTIIQKRDTDVKDKC